MTLDSLLYRFIRPIAPMWFANRYRVQHAAAMRQVGAYDVVSKIGVHSVGGNRTGYGAFLQTIKAAGRRLSVVVCYDDFGAAFEAKQVWPEVLTVGMLTAHSQELVVYYDDLKLKAQQNPWIEYWCVFNEVGGQHAPTYAIQADQYIALLPRMAADGLRLGMFSCASGTPPTPNEDGGACYAEIARATKFAVDNHYDALLCLHEYRGVGQINRYKAMRDYLVARGAMLPLVISEWGDETFRSTSELMQLIRDSDPLYMPDAWVEGCANWTVGGGGWAGSNWSIAFPEVGQYIATVQEATPVAQREFDHWLDEDTGQNLGTANPLTFVIKDNRRIRAISRPKVITYTFQLSSDSADVTVTGGGVYDANSTVSALAVNAA